MLPERNLDRILRQNILLSKVIFVAKAKFSKISWVRALRKSMSTCQIQLDACADKIADNNVYKKLSH